MKKLIFTAILTLLGIMALTSCTNEDNSGKQLTTMITIESSQDLIDACDIEITYKGKGGINTVDTITSTEWHKIIVNDSFPVRIGMVALRYLVKPGFKPDKDFYDLECQHTLLTRETARQREYPCLMLYDVPAGKVAEFLELQNYLDRDMVKLELDSKFNATTVMVSGAKDESARELFIFEDEQSSGLEEEGPVISPETQQ